MAPYSSILAWRIPWTGAWQAVVQSRLSDFHFFFFCMFTPLCLHLRATDKHIKSEEFFHGEFQINLEAERLFRGKEKKE